MGGEDEAETIVKTGTSTQTKSVFTQKCYICDGFDDDSYECMHVKILCAILSYSRALKITRGRH